MGRIVIYGAGGFGREIVTALRGDSRDIVFLSDSPAAVFNGIPMIGLSDIRADDEIVIGVGNGQTRRMLAEKCPGQFGRVAAPSAVIGPDVEMGEGAVLCDFTMITASARIGRHFQCNLHSYVAHDCQIGDFVTFAPRVSCNGNVHIGDGVMVGTGAILRNGTAKRPLRIGAGATIGMGSVVIRDVPAGATVFGNPARVVLQPAETAAA